MNSYPKRGEVHWVNLDPTIGSEINKRRPCVIVSNDAGNEISHRIIVAPVTSTVKHVYPFEVKVEIQNREGKVLLDQIRSIDKQRLCGRITTLNKAIMHQIDRSLKIALGLT
ncbi:MAG: type II toxin-antitoxin system PemK/MazF family toxin [Parachlamydiales bacterium]|nr:type II toxin-antitoxin system PemK/MazF family toxin [Parachlamydiales bacterium]